MTPTQYRDQEGITWQQFAHRISAVLASYGEPPLYYDRLIRLRLGKTSARDQETRALLEMTGNEVDCFKEDV
jgi:hypothetical protein